MLPDMYKHDGVCYLLKGGRHRSLNVKNQVLVDSHDKDQ